VSLHQWIGWISFALAGLYLLFQIVQVRSGAEVQIPTFYQFFGATTYGRRAEVMIVTAFLLYIALGVPAYFVLL
jgi:hypothetical protein